jgi:hypothetical protein
MRKPADGQRLNKVATSARPMTPNSASSSA